ncbi:MAG: nucleoside-diphosphate sugar epimerase/dehydratase [Eubacteriales bacterium]|nr:nucleoside-diphosphate sugar epimerase/dehydratase [Eubacteriales bacterium]MDY3333019.1 nucleoside-diphosphate sugar epimerase/dehydratase [Gallibacter sp.]
MFKSLVLRKWDTSRIFQIILLILDAVFINVASLFAMMARFNATPSEIPYVYMESISSVALYNSLFTVFLISVFKLYNSIWRFASVREIASIFIVVLLSTLFNFLIYFGFAIPIFRSYFILYLLILFAFLFISRFSYRFLRLVYRKLMVNSDELSRVMVIGAGDAGNYVVREITITEKLPAKVVAIIDDDEAKKNTYTQGVKVYGGRDLIKPLVTKLNIDEIIIAIANIDKKELKKIATLCQETDCKVKILPGIYQLVSGEVEISKLRSIEIEDLLGRDAVDINNQVVGKYVAEKIVLVTGGGGSIGSELCRQIAANYPRKLIILDIYENTTYEIQRELYSKYPALNIDVLIGSVRDEKRLEYIFNKYKPDLVFHAAAHKHVPLMEDSQHEAIKNNVFGTKVVCEMADKYNVERVILISTDKAVNPTNIMGASKRMCEMLVQYYDSISNTSYVAVRFGNVLGSNGSVIPFFKKQIAMGGPVTVTHPEIIRYFMTIPEAVSLVLKAGANANGGEIFVLDMGEPVRILDLAKNMIRLSGYEVDKDIEIVFTGLRPGEKLYEELLMDEEGLESTENELIHIGKPLNFDKTEFLEKMTLLEEQLDNEDYDIRPLVKEIVSTYNYK